jgi:hypothetical protein
MSAFLSFKIEGISHGISVAEVEEARNGASASAIPSVLRLIDALSIHKKHSA